MENSIINSVQLHQEPQGRKIVLSEKAKEARRAALFGLFRYACKKTTQESEERTAIRTANQIFNVNDYIAKIPEPRTNLNTNCELAIA